MLILIYIILKTSKVLEVCTKYQVDWLKVNNFLLDEIFPDLVLVFLMLYPLNTIEGMGSKSVHGREG